MTKLHVAEGAQIDDDVDAGTQTADPARGADTESAGAEAEAKQEAATTKRWSARTVGVYLVLPIAVLLLAVGVGYLKWQASSMSTVENAGAQSVSAATETVAAMLTYHADRVGQDLTAASERMTGEFRDEYTTFINDVVIPGAQQGRISAETTVPAAALVSATGNEAEVLVYINQTTFMGDEPPTDSASSARVLLEKVNDQWLISGFEPI